MPLCLVEVQNLLNAQVQLMIYVLESFGQVFMYGALAYSEFFRGRPNGRACIYDVCRKLTGSFLDVCSQKHHSSKGGEWRDKKAKLASALVAF